MVHYHFYEILVDAEKKRKYFQPEERKEKKLIIFMFLI